MQEILFDFAEPGKPDLQEFMLRNYMFNIPITKFAGLTGRSFVYLSKGFQKNIWDGGHPAGCLNTGYRQPPGHLKQATNVREMYTWLCNHQLT